MHAFVQSKSDGIINVAIGIVTSNGKPYYAIHISFLLLFYFCCCGMARVLSADSTVCCVSNCIFRADKPKTHANLKSTCSCSSLTRVETKNKYTHVKKQQKTNKHGICANENRKTSNSNTATKIEKRNMKMI